MRCNDRPLQNVTQFAHVPWPGVRRQPLQSMAVKTLHIALVLAVQVADNGFGKLEEYLLFARAEGSVDAKYIQAVI